MENNSTIQNTNSFSKIRQFFWPVYRHEIKKILPLFGMYFIICFNYHILKCLKTTLAVKRCAGGAEVLPFFKIWVIFPAAVFATYIYSKYTHTLNKTELFNRALLCFLIYFLVFVFILYPYQASLQLNGLAQILQSILPEGLHGLTAIIRFWPSTLFYVASELWSTMIISVLFWTFTNELMSIGEARRFYAFIALGANMAGVFSGCYVQKLPELIRRYNVSSLDHWHLNLYLSMSLVILGCLGLFYLIRYVSITHNLASTMNEQNICLNDEKLPSMKEKYSFIHSLQYLSKSKYAACIALTVVCFNIVYNLMETILINELNHNTQDSLALNALLGKVDTYTGAFSMILSFIVFNNINRLLGWRVTFLVTPVVWLIGGTLFLWGIIYQDSHLMQAVGILTRLSVHMLVLNIGLFYMSVGKSTKYCIFDQAKEIAYIPIDRAHQKKTKAMIDGIGSRFGKTIGAILLQLLLLTTGGQISHTLPIISVFIIILCIIWVVAAYQIGQTIDKSAKKLNQKKTTDKKLLLVTT